LTSENHQTNSVVYFADHCTVPRNLFLIKYSSYIINQETKTNEMHPASENIPAANLIRSAEPAALLIINQVEVLILRQSPLFSYHWVFSVPYITYGMVQKIVMKSRFHVIRYEKFWKRISYRLNVCI
jgi:hypothetical protein